MRGVRIDLTGQRFGRLTVIGFAGKLKGKIRWRCLCDCGNEVTVSSGHLRPDGTKSCRCLLRETVTARQIKHGLSTSQFYDAWAHIKDRCFNPRSKCYKDYGGRGVTVCERWIQFENFRDDMLPSFPGKGWSIERDDVDGIYEPQNCKWILKEHQARNQRKTVRLEIGQKFGAWEVISGPEWGIKRGTAYRCRCICGIQRFVRAYMLKGGSSRSCGCVGGGQRGLLAAEFVRTQKLFDLPFDLDFDLAA